MAFWAVNRTPGMLLLAAGVLGFVSSSAAPPAAGNAYRNAEFGYRYDAPAAWEQKVDMPRNTSAFLGPTEQGFTANLTVTVYAEKVETTDLLKFANGFKVDHARVLDRHKCTVAGEPGYTWRTLLTLPGHPPAENRQVVCVHNHRAYELTFTVGAGQMNKGYTALCDKWLASFGWLKPTSPLLPRNKP